MFLKIGSAALLLVLAPLALGAQPLPLTDRSFFVEEAWRADSNVVQHGLSFEDGGWTYTWTQEWAAPDRLHRIGYSLPLLVNGGSALLGTASLDWAVQLRGFGSERVALSPRASLLLPLASPTAQRSRPGFELALPVTVSHGARLATHWNIRAGRPAEDEPLETALAIAAAQLVSERAIAVFESELRAHPLADDRRPELTVSAGLRWTFGPLASRGLVPGFAVPATFGRGETKVGVVFQLMFEHLFPSGD